MATADEEKNPWQTANAPDGRTYYYHAVTNQVSWDMPDEAKWRIHVSAEGKKYYEDTKEKTTTWDRPKCLGEDPAQKALQLAQPPQQQLAKREDRIQYRSQFVRGRDHQSTTRGDEIGRGSRFFPPIELDAGQYAQAEQAFLQLLQKHGVEPGWTHERMIAVCGGDPSFRAIKDPKDRSRVFKRYIQEAESKTRERETQRLATLRKNFNFMLESHPEITANTSWDQALPFIQAETIFRSTDNDEEKQKFFQEYIDDMKERSIQEQDNARRAAIRELPDLLASLSIKPVTPFNEAHQTLIESEHYKKDSKFSMLSRIDILLGYEKYGNSVEINSNASKASTKEKDLRRKRHIREDFLNIIYGLRRSGNISLLSPYEDVRPLIKDRSCYIEQFDMPGMMPAEIYWDLVDEENRKTGTAMNILRDARVRDATSLPFNDFADLLKHDPRTRDWDQPTLQTIQTRIMEESKQREKRSSRDHDRSSKHKLIDRLRSRIKHLQPAVRVSDSWRDVRRRVEMTEEYRALESDEDRLQAFDRHIRRLKEKDSNGRTPDANAYEADRRKAEEKRERQQYRRSGTGLSPPPSRSGDRYDSRSFSDRRDREVGRGFSGSRADPRDKGVAALDYDDGGSSARSPYSRKRRGSSIDDRRHREGSFTEGSSKRRREESYASATPSKDATKEAEKPKEDDYKSGSEEGEIEE